MVFISESLRCVAVLLAAVKGENMSKETCMSIQRDLETNAYSYGAVIGAALLFCGLMWRKTVKRDLHIDEKRPRSHFFGVLLTKIQNGKPV